MRYLMIDHITDWKSEDFMRGVKNITMSEDFLAFHFPDNPVMPGALLLEALVQLAGWFEAESSGFKRWFLMDRVKKCSFYGFALPGDQVELEVRPLSSTASETKSYKGIGTADGKKKLAARFEGRLIPISKIDDPVAFRHTFSILTRDTGS